MDSGKIKKISAKARRTTFNEVSLGLSLKEARKEAERCLQCKNPTCIQGCPLKIDIKEFIRLITLKDYYSALKKIREKNPLPGVCGRVCPQEELCQQTCVLNKRGSPIKIGYLERFSSDFGGEAQVKKADTKKRRYKVAVVGSGPAGLTCAYELINMGFSVTVFEALHKPGGVLIYGIPEFRLPKAIINKEIEWIKRLGVEVRTNFAVGKTRTIEELKKDGFIAFFIAVGAGAPVFLNIPGENLSGVYYANEFLTRTNLMKGYLFPSYHTPVTVGRKVAVIGAGDVAFDCARTALRLGASEVCIVYRRTEEEMPARIEERGNAKEEGVKLILLTSPQRFIPDSKGNVKGIICVKNKLGEPDASGRRRPVPIPNSEFEISVDTIIIAIGTQVNPLLISTIKGLKLTKKGYIAVNDEFQTSIPYVFAGGDIVSGTATVVSAIHQAKCAASGIKKFLPEN